MEDFCPTKTFPIISGIQVTQGHAWHPGSNPDGGQDYLAWMKHYSELSRFCKGSNPTAAQVELRSPFDHSCAAVEFTSPALRVMNDQGAVQLQCTRTMYDQFFALSGDNRSRATSARHHKKERDYDMGDSDGWDTLSKKQSGIIVEQSIPTDDEIEHPASDAMHEAPVWLQVVAGIQHLRERSKWGLAEGADDLSRTGGVDVNANTIRTPVRIKRPDSGSRHGQLAATVDLDGDVGEYDACTVGVQVRYHKQLMMDLGDLLGISVEQVDWPWEERDGKMWRVER